MSGFWPDGNAEPYTLDQLGAAARVLADELGFGWKVWAATYPEGPRLIVRKWPPLRDDDEWIIEPTLEAARQRVAERGGGTGNPLS